MRTTLSPVTAFLLTLPTLLWAGNAVVGRILAPLAPPLTLNLLRWALAVVLLLPLGWRLWGMRAQLAGSLKPLALMGLLGVGCYNAFQYMALKTSTPLNVTLVAASMPLWMMLVGALFFGERPGLRQGVAALCSISGVLVVLSGGQWQRLAALHLVPGDVLMLAAAVCWAGYSWLLMRAQLPAELRGDWAAFLLAQILCGLVWSGLSTTVEWQVGQPHIVWGWPLLLGLVYLAVGPSLIAYRCWGLGVQRAGPTVAAFFSNLTPLFAAILSAALLGETPQAYHALAFALIVAGIVISARK
ncbi:MAG: DMT family transporter [Comamonadaceae bacterium]|nr:DMT family transporter [Comamonadaceae bacterium]